MYTYIYIVIHTYIYIYVYAAPASIKEHRSPCLQKLLAGACNRRLVKKEEYLIIVFVVRASRSPPAIIVSSARVRGHYPSDVCTQGNASPQPCSKRLLAKALSSGNVFTLEGSGA